MLFASVSCTKSCNPTIRETSLLLLEKTNRITNLAGVVGIRFVYHILYLGLGRILSSEKKHFCNGKEQYHEILFFAKLFNLGQC